MNLSEDSWRCYNNAISSQQEAENEVLEKSLRSAM